MIQLRVLRGKQAGAQRCFRRYPIRVGRQPQADLPLEDAGVWDNHLEIHLSPSEGHFLTSRPGALTVLNTRAVQTARLRPGDRIQLGGAEIEFELAPVPQKADRWREILLWCGLGVLCAVQLALVYWLER